MTTVIPTVAASDKPAGGESLLTDFTAASSDLGWYVVNDNVMGGRSDGDFVQEEGVLKFAGRTNTRGGGFSSIRTRSLQLDLSKHTGVQLAVKGDGRRYTWRLTTDASWRGRPISYWADFETHGDSWITVDIPFTNFVPRYRGSRLEGPALDPRKITGMGLMIYDKLDGPFEVQLASVQAYPAEPLAARSQRQEQKTVRADASILKGK